MSIYLSAATLCGAVKSVLLLLLLLLLQQLLRLLYDYKRPLVPLASGWLSTNFSQ